MLEKEEKKPLFTNTPEVTAFACVQDFRRDVDDVCNIFKELAGAEAQPAREASVIVPFVRDYGWGAWDFRLMIEYSLRDPQSRAFLDQPGRMNLRSIFHSGRVGLVLDIHSDLKRAKQIEVRRSEHLEESPDLRINRIRLHCCREVFESRYVKVPIPFAKTGQAQFKWQWTNQADYEAHACQSVTK